MLRTKNRSQWSNAPCWCPPRRLSRHCGACELYDTVSSTYQTIERLLSGYASVPALAVRTRGLRSGCAGKPIQSMSSSRISARPDVVHDALGEIAKHHRQGPRPIPDAGVDISRTYKATPSPERARRELLRFSLLGGQDRAIAQPHGPLDSDTGSSRPRAVSGRCRQYCAD